VVIAIDDDGPGVPPSQRDRGRGQGTQGPSEDPAWRTRHRHRRRQPQCRDTRRPAARGARTGQLGTADAGGWPRRGEAFFQRGNRWQRRQAGQAHRQMTTPGWVADIERRSLGSALRPRKSFRNCGGVPESFHSLDVPHDDVTAWSFLPAIGRICRMRRERGNYLLVLPFLISRSTAARSLEPSRRTISRTMPGVTRCRFAK
jgi:hypothetical protein